MKKTKTSERDAEEKKLEFFNRDCLHSAMFCFPSEWLSSAEEDVSISLIEPWLSFPAFFFETS